MNKIILLGRLTRDLELQEIETKAGNTMVIGKGSLAVQQTKDEAIFFNFKIFGKQAETLKTFTEKGNRIVIEGALRQETFEAKDGTKKVNFIVNVGKFDIIDFKKKEGEDLEF